ncbi:DUF1905 domain-containing protein [Qipengyuania sp.]|uniref:DUF1905 domain-containing protein n=1 Tax=Qipengyuania sp. TaxID=2004515 RepID=UPI003AF4FAEE
MEPVIPFSAVLGSVFIEEGFDPAYFLVLPDAAQGEVAARVAGRKRAFGSVKVAATIGQSRWETTLLRREDRYVLPVKKPVRLAETLTEGDEVHAAIEVL